MEAQEGYQDEPPRLTTARNDFVASLSRRLDALRAALRSLEEEPSDVARRDNLLRRMHAMSAAAKVLGFDSVGEALSHAERVVRRAVAEPEKTDFREVARALDVVPSLVLGAPAAVRHESNKGAEERAVPISVLVFGAPELVEQLVQDSEGRLEADGTDDPVRGLELARAVGPDVVLVDSDRRLARNFAEALRHDAATEGHPIVVIGSFENPELASNFVALGATRVLPKPVSPDTLRRSLLEVAQQPARPRSSQPVGEVTVAALAERINSEVQRGLVEAVAGGASESIDLGEGAEVLAAVWGAVARIRELVTMQSQGAVRFDSSGPEGAVPLAPWTRGERRAGERALKGARGSENVTLSGRSVLVADDDPAVVWFMSGVLRAVGATVIEAHDGERALALALERWPHLVVSDTLMPGLDGFSLCRELKRDVVVRDVPVVLLSWKEDLLQRVRELGSDADGYLKKEATASQVVQRLREVMLPRARVEQRMQLAGEVRGRLDGLTPRLILELCAKHKPNCRLSVRDAVYLYEVELRNGQPRSATRTSNEGDFERGVSVLGALLGVNAGRFVATPDTGNCRDDLHGVLSELLAGPIQRARATQRALRSQQLAKVGKISIDEKAVGAYIAASPEPARGLMERLKAGETVRDVLLSGSVDVRMLEGVLSDLSRRGGVAVVESVDGRDLIEQAADSLRVPLLDDGPSAPPQFTLELSPAAPAPSEGVDAAWEELADAAPVSALPLSRDLTPPPFNEQVLAKTARSVTPRPKIQTPWPSKEASTQPGIGAAVSERSRAYDEAAKTQALGHAVLDGPLTTSLEPLTTLVSGDEMPAATEPVVVKKVVMPTRPIKSSLAATLPSAPDATGPEKSPRPALEVIERPLAKTLQSASDVPPQAQSDESINDGAPELEMGGAESLDDDELAMLEQAADALAEPSPAPSKPAEARASEQPEEHSETPNPVQTKTPATKKIEFPPRAAGKSTAGEAAARVAATSSPLMATARVVALMGATALVSFGVVRWMVGPQAQQAPAATVAAAKKAAAPAAKVEDNDEPVRPEQPSERPSAAKPGDEPAGKVEEMGLPAGIVLPADKGLLEVTTDAQDSIYVDGAFVGRGPLRRVPVSPGTHQVEIRNEGAGAKRAVNVTQNKRTQVTFGNPLP